MRVNSQAKREAKQLFRFCQANGSLDEDRLRQVVRHVLAANYRNCPAVLSHLLRLIRLDFAQHTANVESATPLAAELQTVTENSLKRMYGSRLATVFAQRPSLIGGMRIQVGCDVYDGSVLAGLAALEKSL